MSLALILTLALAGSTPAVAVETPLPGTLDLTRVRALVVQYDGRWMPLDTMARDTVESVTGTAYFQGHDPVLLLLGWTFKPESWKNQPLISISNIELRAELSLPETQTIYSCGELEKHEPLRMLFARLIHMESGRKLDPLEDKVSDIGKKLRILRQAFSGESICVIPAAKGRNDAWLPIVSHSVQGSPGQESVWSAWSDLGEAFRKDDAAGFSATAERLTTALAALPAAHRPDPKLIATELHYNRLQPFHIASRVMVLAAVLAVVALVVRRRWFDVPAVLGMLAGFAVLSYGLWLRWQIAGRIPAANMFESLLFLSWGMGAFAIFSMLVMRNRTVPLIASAMGALALFLADALLGHDSYIRPIVPVLMDTVWMSIHVPVIMVSYSVLALAMVIAHVQLVVMAFAPHNSRLIAQIDGFHYWHIHVGSILLLAGIITGSMWGASSWGRYWGWDPKEVWSLIAFLGYLTILHVRADRQRVSWWAYLIGGLLIVALFVVVVQKLAPLSLVKGFALAGTALAIVLFVVARGRLATALKSVLCFWLILMTYLGVNYVLGTGLHSYGFGKGAVARYMLLLGVIDLAVALALCAIHLARGRQEARGMRQEEGKRQEARGMRQEEGKRKARGKRGVAGAPSRSGCLRSRQPDGVGDQLEPISAATVRERPSVPHPVRRSSGPAKRGGAPLAKAVGHPPSCLLPLASCLMPLAFCFIPLAIS
ncbi:MAG: cytochrome c biogenesis protein CcsA [Phycisphaerae bacterium]|nr:cytochrome c biogenesis protein CcsA [Phycisphaerae bacterium]